MHQYILRRLCEMVNPLHHLSTCFHSFTENDVSWDWDRQWQFIELRCKATMSPAYTPQSGNVGRIVYEIVRILILLHIDITLNGAHHFTFGIGGFFFSMILEASSRNFSETARLSTLRPTTLKGVLNRWRRVAHRRKTS